MYDLYKRVYSGVIDCKNNNFFGAGGETMKLTPLTPNYINTI